MKKLVLFLIPVIFSVQVSAQCQETAQPKVLLIGDSWAFFMSVDQTINSVFKRWGHSDCSYYTNLVLSENGAETDDFLGADKQQEIVNKLNEYPSIEFIHVSIGGNDALGDWNIDFTQAETDTLVAHISNRLVSLVNFLKTTKPGIKIFWSGYVYPNFGEVIETADPFQTSHPFYSTWQGMGYPTFQQINGILNMFSDKAQLYADTVDDFDYVMCPGLMQYTFGQEETLGVPPGGTYAPFAQPLPYGDPSYPSPKESMRDYGLTKDCFHLSPQGYVDFIDYHTRKYYHKALMHDYFSVAADSGQNGSIGNLGTLSDSLFMGGQSGETFSPLLTFNLQTMADTGIEKASIFIRRQNLMGNNPISTLNVKIKAGHFGNSTGLESSDIDVIPSAEGTPCLFGSNNENGDWIRLDLPENLYPYLQAGNTVQFIVSSNTTNGLVEFSNAAEPDFAPVLDIKYGQKTTPVTEVIAKGIDIYPNPTNGIINIKSSNNVNNATIDLYDLTGRLKYHTNFTGQNIDITAVTPGAYIIKLTTAGNTYFYKIIKK